MQPFLQALLFYLQFCSIFAASLKQKWVAEMVGSGVRKAEMGSRDGGFKCIKCNGNV